MVHCLRPSTTPRAATLAVRVRRAGRLAVLPACLLPGLLHAAPDAPWTVAGQQGFVRSIIVPQEQVRDRAAYFRQIEALCEPGTTCFLNFFTNSTGAPLAMPLPDAIDHEATAVFRRSAKRPGDIFRWSCRLQIPQEDCF
jgi:hypothetical protein